MIDFRFKFDNSAEWGIFAPKASDFGDNDSAADSTATEESAFCAENNIVLPVQTHTDTVGVLTEPGQTFPDTDALVTSLRGVGVGVRTADCVPVVIYAPDIKAVAAVHAGWKGTLARIASKTVRMMVMDMGADPELMKAAIGACVCGECYEVDESLAEMFEKKGLHDCVLRGEFTDPLGRQEFDPRRPHIDLAAANRKALLTSGLLRRNIQMPELCSRHWHDEPDDTRLPSWRRCPGERQRMVTWIKLH